MCCEASSDEEDKVAIPIREALDEVRASNLLYLQGLLLRSRLRGDCREVANWVKGGCLPAEVASNSDAVGVLVFAGNRRSEDSHPFELQVEPYGTMMGLDGRDFLSGEVAFTGIRGTCCAIGERTILTAGHVLDRQERRWLAGDKLCVLFGFRTQTDGVARTVFDPASQLAWVVPPAGFDPEMEFEDEWLTLELDRTMAQLGGRRYAEVSNEPLEDNAAVYTFGHPNGLSLRYSFSPSTLPGPEDACFRAFVDGYDKASGSPVFDAVSHKIVGIAVASGQEMGIVRVENQDSLSQVCTPLTSAGVSCLRRPVAT